ncbi:type II toxin-antitoxin system RatA family toxin [Actinokineospora pegani]|uniref:type II toxin-antitoxin system RatA family toxin n=1 Tax=Actinokineospora pegani TaxID=2654637 RepID=UPI0012EAA5A0|nr:SRPBCC family protein [Actinokineospora pegani]
MTSRILRLTLPGTAARIVEALAEDIRFPGMAEDVISVSAAGADLRSWVLAFRGGTARWTQRVTRTAGDGRHTVAFEQVSGDFTALRGSWTCTDTDAGCEVVYEVVFSTSVPHLAGAINSAVGRVLVRSAHQIVSALGPVRVVAGGQYLSDLPEGFLPGRVLPDPVRLSA